MPCTEGAQNSRAKQLLRWLILSLLLLLLGLQYRLWWGEGGRLEVYQLEQQAAEYERENDVLRARNAELTRQVLDLKSGNTVLEQRAREELGLTRDDELFFQFAPEETESTGRGVPLGDVAPLGQAAQAPGSESLIP
ncbi:MAG: hypothetical protein Cons2KO_05610 [Congregibacter sp.]